ncbi:MAG: rhodanese-like domain-containing protein [Anaerolineae bacterium]|nr:MAG: rhodanese-like domain-containing protein [Anaerolineae bacterium]
MASKTKTQAQQAHRRNRRPAKQSFFQKNAKWLIPSVGVLLLVIIGAVVLLGDDSKSGSLDREISVKEAAEMRDDGAFILDVREPEEWADFHIPGATLIPLGDLASRVDELPKDQEIVVVCRSGNRSQEGRDILLDAGFDKVTSMAGGVTEWRSAGYPIE